jgi:phosphatidylglycerol:prolipoprotein diacylglycerol transferase
MQAVGRWGNFFNQELYGPPTTLPWGIPIDCEHRLPVYACDALPIETTRFHPLFLYESISGLLGAAVLILLFTRYRHRFAPGSLLFVFFIWYGVVRFALEALRENNWIAFGIPTAQLVSVGFILVGFVGLLVRNSGPAGRRREELADPDDDRARGPDEDADLETDPDPAAGPDDEAHALATDDARPPTTPSPGTPPASG